MGDGPADQVDQVKTKRTVSLLGRARQPSCCVGTAKSVVAGHPKSTGQGRVPRLEQSTQLHTNPSQPPVHSRLLPRPPHCRTGPLPLATPLVCTVRKLPRIHPPSPSPCLLPPLRLKPQGSACLACLRLFCCSPLQPIVSCHPAPYFPCFFSSYPLRLPAHYHSPDSLLLPFRPPSETLADACLPPSLSPPHHSTYTLLCPGSADGLGVHHLKIEERGIRPSRGQPSITSPLRLRLRLRRP